jgi:hypothetical protein
MSIHYQVCRKLGVDIHGDILLSRKPISGLFKRVYPEIIKRDRNFVLRIDRLRPSKSQMRLTPFVLQKLEKEKFEAFYHLRPSKLRQLIIRQKKIKGNAIENLFFFLESQIHIILWRLQFFNRHSIREILAAHNILVNGLPLKSPSSHVNPGDFITIHKYPNLLQERLSKGKLRLREKHLLVDYSTLCVIPMYMPSNPFFYFKYDLSYIIFTPRYK